MGVSFCLSSSVDGGGSALAVIEVTGSSAGVEGLLGGVGVDRLPGEGGIGLRDVAGVDRALVARVSAGHVLLFPHGGRYVLGRLREALVGAGGEESGARSYAEVGVEGGDGVFEACLLEALSRCVSPVGVGVLIGQREAWTVRAGGFEGGSRRAGERARVLGRLLEPAVVAVVGRANAGKSTLTNALARRGVSVVAEEAGTTRDHVGASLVLDGLAVRYLDTPGLLEGAVGVDREAIGLASEMVATADLVLACGDPGHEPPGVGPGQGVLRVCLRRDLCGPGGDPGWEADAEVSAREGEGLDGLARLVRRRLVPDAVLADPRPWRFWEG